MNLGAGHYRKIRLRSDAHRRWAKMRERSSGRSAGAAAPPPGSGAALAGAYLAPDDEQRVVLKKAAVFALVVHFLLFLVVVPQRPPEQITAERAAATVVKRYTPPSPPAKAKKVRRKKKAAVVPIPDPTPEEPEPIEPEEGEEDFGEFDEEYVVGEPTGVPGISSGARSGAYRAGEGGVMSPVIIRKVEPEYTPEATRRGIQGEVWIEAVVDVDGHVVEPRLLRGLPDEELNRRAMEAIQQWLFKPGMKDGQPVPIIAIFTVEYRLH